jgi:hypothetical protein
LIIPTYSPGKIHWPVFTATSSQTKNTKKKKTAILENLFMKNGFFVIRYKSGMINIKLKNKYEYFISRIFGIMEYKSKTPARTTREVEKAYLSLLDTVLVASLSIKYS